MVLPDYGIYKKLLMTALGAMIWSASAKRRIPANPGPSKMTLVCAFSKDILKPSQHSILKMTAWYASSLVIDVSITFHR